MSFKLWSHCSIWRNGLTRLTGPGSGSLCCVCPSLLTHPQHEVGVFFSNMLTMRLVRVVCFGGAVWWFRAAVYLVITPYYSFGVFLNMYLALWISKAIFVTVFDVTKSLGLRDIQYRRSQVFLSLWRFRSSISRKTNTDVGPPTSKYKRVS